jgi:hypothetical protein
MQILLAVTLVAATLEVIVMELSVATSPAALRKTPARAGNPASAATKEEAAEEGGVVVAMAVTGGAEADEAQHEQGRIHPGIINNDYSFKRDGVRSYAQVPELLL